MSDRESVLRAALERLRDTTERLLRALPDVVILNLPEARLLDDVLTALAESGVGGASGERPQ